jgi:hypothetical protein
VKLLPLFNNFLLKVICLVNSKREGIAAKEKTILIIEESPLLAEEEKTF